MKQLQDISAVYSWRLRSMLCDRTVESRKPLVSETPLFLVQLHISSADDWSQKLSISFCQRASVKDI